MIKRNIVKKILEHYKQYPIISLIGPRQSGKTTLVKSIFPKKPYINLEDIENREFALSDPKGFLSQYEDGVIIDEVQRAPELMSYIQVMSDKKKKNGLYVLTGSQNFLLMEKISQSLAGRVAIFKLLPFSMRELFSAKVKFSGTEINNLLFKGFYPKLFDQKIDIAGYYANYIQTYVERDVRLIKNISSLSSFKRFLNLCAARTGQLLNISSLAEDCGINHKTAQAWLSIMEASFIIYLLRPHYKNYNKRVIKMPKIYFYDTGLLCSLLGLTDQKQLEGHYLKGSIFESFVISEFMKHKYNQGAEPNVYFWRNKAGNEIDLLIETADKLIPIEIKSGQTITSDYFKGLNYYNNLSRGSRKNSYVIYGGHSKQRRTEGSVLGWEYLCGGISKILG
ncbi:MAG: ATP-binding protein [Candidatus Falkowbacteria bacterium]|nr:ATP-binding protein [Candidatus Parcubacteria bacterium]